MFGAPKDVSRFRVFGCKALVYLNKERQENGKHTARGINAINLGFARNISAYVLYIPGRKTLMTSNQIKFNEHEFPFRKQKMVKQFLSDNATDILFKSASGVKWVVYNELHVGNYSEGHHDKVSDVIVLRVNSQENTFTRVLMHKWVLDQMELLEQVHYREIQANFAEITYRPLRGLDPRINPDKPPRNHKEAIKAIDSQAWAAAYNLEYIGFKVRGVFKVERPEQGI